jgi:HNH endonuclease
MPRGARKDTAVTKLLLDNGLLLDKRSFVSLDGNKPHLFLRGADVGTQRERIWQRSKGKCSNCLRVVIFGFFDDWEMDHIQGGLSGRCDCLHNVQALCRDCHAKKTREKEHH